MYVVPVKSKMKVLQNFVAFSEYMNFITEYLLYVRHYQPAFEYLLTIHKDRIY